LKQTFHIFGYRTLILILQNARLYESIQKIRKKFYGKGA
jgi:hypothetical protein